MISILMTAALIAVPAVGVQDNRVQAAFEHYEAIRSSLSADSMTDVARHGTALALFAEELAGTDAKKAAEALAGAKDVKAARESFGRLSSALIPVFEKAGLKDVQFFTCPMVKQSWAQKGTDVQNPYYGKAMLTCGAPKK